jgi:hypothetical protein
MNTKIKDFVKEELTCVIDSKNQRPYIFRTRLERALLRIMALANDLNRADIKEDCNRIKERFAYISNESNQTSDGTLKSFICLEKDLLGLLEKVNTLN